MLKILFVCHGNICRSPMAEYVIRNMLKEQGIDNVITASAATSTEEIGNPVHHGTAAILRSLGIDFSDKRARQMTKKDYKEYDLLIGMDSANIRNMLRIVGEDTEKKIYRLLEFADETADISDPWYTGDFERTYYDVERGCKGLIKAIQNNSINVHNAAVR